MVPVFTLADRLRKAREQTGMEQGPFAALVGISRVSVSNAERGANRPHHVTLIRWAEIAGVPLEWLLTGEAPHDGPDGGSAVTDSKVTSLRILCAA